MSELKKELEQDKAFIEEVADRIYSDTDDIEESMPDSEWIERMTDIADKYITRFETSYNFANNLADELRTSNIQLNDNQKIVLEWLKETSEKYAIKMNPIASIYTLHSNYVTNDTADIFDAYEELSDVEEAKVIQAFSTWVLEQEEDHNGIN